MSYWIPRLEWNDQTITGTTSTGNATITGITSTANINVGMICTGTGIQADSKVLSKTLTSVTLDKTATGSATVSLTFFERYDFEFPPVKDTDEVWKAKQNVIDSLNGTQQFQNLYLEATRAVEYWFVNQTDADKLKTNFFMYVYQGAFFRYYPDKDEVEVFNYQLEPRTYERVRQVKKHPYFKFKINFIFRRVVA